MKSHAKSRAGQYRKMALALSLVLGVSPLQADTAIEPAKDSPVAALLRHAIETNLEQLPADLVKFKAHYLELLEMHRSSAHSKATHQVTNCNNSGPGSLRAAVAAAASGDTVDLSGLSCTTITLTESIVTDVDSLTLKDSGGVREISGGNSIRPITHNGTGTLTLDGVSVVNGRHSSIYHARGGCIYSKGNVALGRLFGRGAQVRDCEAIGAGNATAKGGGIYAMGTVSLFDSAVKRSKATTSERNSEGGGIFAKSGLGMLGGVIEGNEARGMSAAGGGALAKGINAKYATVRDNKVITLGNSNGLYATGGGLEIWSGSSESLIQAVTISDNSVKVADASSSGARVSGSGIYVLGESLTINSSTIANNISEGGRTVRGALAIAANVTIKASTISGNKARSLSQPNERGWGAGIAMFNNRNLTLQSSIVAGNNIASISGQSLASDIGVFFPEQSISTGITGERNFINFYNADISWASTNNDISPEPVNLEPLQDNGGLTLTMMPRADSPVINRGLDLGLDYDQRGGGYARVYGPQVDIGAMEYGSIHMGIFHDHFE